MGQSSFDNSSKDVDWFTVTTSEIGEFFGGI